MKRKLKGENVHFSIEVMMEAQDNCWGLMISEKAEGSRLSRGLLTSGGH